MYLYLLESDGFYKVGVANNVRKRIDNLQIGNPHKINLVAKCNIKYADAFTAERNIHIVLNGLNVSGEWFRLLPQDVELLKETYQVLENNDFSSLELMEIKWENTARRIYS